MPGTTDPAIRREQIERAVLARITTSPERRQEALFEFFRVTRPDLGETGARAMAEGVPPLVPELHAKWAAMFSARLVETVPENQVAELCDGTPENGAALTLAYLMFLESERMEKQTAADIKAYRQDHPELAERGRGLADRALARREAARHAKAVGYAGGKKRRPN